MNLHEYLNSDGALTATELGKRINVENVMQIRQWQHGYGGRKPSLANAAAIERATEGKVTAEELRPDAKWMRVPDETWPHEKGRPVYDAANDERKVRA